MSLLNDLENAANDQSFDSIGGTVANKSVARFKIKVQRLTSTLGQTLPAAIFGRQFLASGYNGIIDVPSGLTLTVTSGLIQGTASNYHKIILSYTDGADTDIIEITSQSAAAYPTLLEATLSDVFNVDYFKFSTASGTLDQLEQDMEIKRQSLFGKVNADSVNIDMFKSSTQFQSGIVEANMKASFDKSTAMVVPMIASPVILNITMSATHIVKFNANKLK